MTASLLVRGKWKMAVMTAVTAVLLPDGALDTGTDFSVVITG